MPAEEFEGLLRVHRTAASQSMSDADLSQHHGGRRRRLDSPMSCASNNHRAALAPRANMAVMATDNVVGCRHAIDGLTARG